MHIVLPIYGFGLAGGYRVIAQLGTEWVRRGHRVQLLAHHSSAAPYFPTEAEVLWLDDDGERLQDDQRDRTFDRRGIGAVRCVMSALQRGLSRYAATADVVLANQSFTAWPVRLSRVSARKFYYIQAYEPDFFVEGPLFRRSILSLISYSSYFAGLRQIVNAPLYRRYKAIRADLVVPPGIDLSLMYPAETRVPWTGRTIRLGCIGRREPWKGTMIALDAFEEMRRRGYPVEMHVAFGNLPEHRPVPQGCQVVTPTSDGELGEYYRSLDVMIAPGTVQLGAVHYPVLEAMACGVPVITTGYLPAMPSNAWLVPIHDPVAIADAVGEMLQQPVDRLCRVAQALQASADYAWPRVAERMLGLFEEGAT